MPEPVVPARTYALVFAALAALTGLTTGAAYINLGVFHTAAALLIAAAKAALVALFFMHIRYSSRLMWIFAGAGLFWLGIMVGFTMADVLTRGPASAP
jgi:cytochrome c oxidase subunit 4